MVVTEERSEIPWPADLFDGIRRGDGPLHAQVSQRLEAAIRSGALPSGARVENELDLAARLGVSRPTVRRAIQDLVDAGLVVRRRGIGTQVVQGHITRPVELTSLYDDLVRSDHDARTEILDHRVVRAGADVAERLGLPAGTRVTRLRRRRTADGVPVAVLENHIPADLVDLDDADLVAGGLYSVLRRHGIEVRVARQRIGARRAKVDEGGLLGVDRGAPVLTMERVGFDGSGRAVEFGRHCYRPDVYDFETTLVAR